MVLWWENVFNFTNLSIDFLTQKKNNWNHWKYIIIATCKQSGWLQHFMYNDYILALSMDSVYSMILGSIYNQWL